MKRSSRRVSRARSIVCPRCEVGEVRSRGPSGARCDFCGRAVDGTVLALLRRIVALPDALGSHACECGHPEMRRLPDGVHWCPACGSEVLPVKTNPTFAEGYGEAWRDGWTDGCFEEPGGVARSKRLARWEDPRDRLDYYRGRRAGQESGEEGCGPGIKLLRSL